jgi:signal transduction histidine kinase/DNA-binding response OmpR family regulator/ligand-binding sensor domain-containing protein
MVKDGLAHQEVYDIHQDARGFMWIGTRSGLSRYNGYTFQTFTKEKNGLSNNSIQQIHEDAGGYLWLFSQARLSEKSPPQSIDLLNITSGEVTPFSKQFPQAPFAVKDIQYFFAAPNQDIFFYTTDKLWKYTAAKGFTTVTIPAGFLPRGCAGETGFWGVQENHYAKTNLNGQVLARFPVDSIAFTRILYMNAHAAYIIHALQKKPILLADNDPSQQFLPKQFPYKEVLNINYQAQEQQLWVAGTRELHILDKAGKLQYSLDNNTEESFERLIRKIYFDKTGLAWIATESGVFLIETRKEKFTRYLFTERADKQNQPFIQCRGILQYDNLLYIGTYKGTYKINLSNNSSAVLPPLTENGVPFGSRFVIIKDGQQLIMGAKMPVFADAATGVEQRYIKGVKQGAWSMFKDKHNRLLIGTERGLLVYDTRKSDTVELFNDYNRFTELAGKFVLSITRDRAGTLWLVTSNGLYILDEDKGVVEHFGTEEKNGRQLITDNLQHLYQDAAGIYWLSSGNAGLIRWNRKTGEQKQFSRENGLSSNNIYAAYEDKRGFLWLSSDYGLMRFNKADEQVTVYTTEDGINHYEFNRISHHQAADGRIYFGSLNGVTAFYPEAFYDSSHANANNIMIAGFQQYLGAKGNLVDMTNELIHSKRIVLQPADRFFSFTLAVPDFMNIARTVYYYKIDGLDKDWIKTTNNEIRFGRQPYGEYTLRIKAQMPNGNMTNEMILQIHSKRPWYLQWWFYVLAVVLTGLAVRLFYQWRIRLLQLRKKELEQIVAARTQELETDKATIEKQALELMQLDEMKSNFFVNVAHELRTPLTLIAGPVNSLMLRSNEKETDYPYLKLMEQNVHQLQNKVNEILDFSKLDAGKLDIRTEPVQLYDFIATLVSPFEYAAAQKKVQFEWDCTTGDTGEQYLLDKGKLTNILNNLLSNALKFTPPEGHIHFLTTAKDNHLQFTVKDSGPGIGFGEQENIFKRYYQVKTPYTFAGGTGIGLAFTKELLQLLQGTITVESEEGRGATFVIRLPIVKAYTDFTNENPPATGAAGTLTQWEAAAETESPLPPIIEKDTTILLVEDNPGLQQFICLELKQFNMVIANNGLEALSILENRDLQLPPIQLIISDIMMPVMDGFSFLEQLKKHGVWQQIPVIMLTARAHITDKLQALRIGVDDYMVKPFVTAELIARVENLLQRFYTRKQLQQEVTENEVPLQPAWLQQLEQLISHKLHSGENFTTDDLAAAMYISTRQLQRNIKTATGLTLNFYVRELRLHHARQLLEKSSYTTVAEYSFAAGFNDAHYFSKLFTERFGKKPIDYLS